jgi:WhiB family redox-sensing transcriptional regulator
MSYNPGNPFPPLSDRNERTLRVVPVNAPWITVAADSASFRGGACVGLDPDLMFPETGGGVAAAKKLCGACPVRDACLSDALDDGTRVGVWGGTTQDERLAMKRAEYNRTARKKRRDRQNSTAADG